MNVFVLNPASCTANDIHIHLRKGNLYSHALFLSKGISNTSS